jgi:pyruvate-formate lyase
MRPMPSPLHPVVRQALEFTETYKRHRDDHPAIREATCLKTQYPALMGPIGPGDMFAGAQAADRITYLGTMWWAQMPHRDSHGKQGGYCFDFSAAERYQDSPADREAVEGLVDYWRDECTFSKILAQWDDEMLRYLRPGGAVDGGGSGFVTAPDLDLLVRRGIPGLVADVQARRAGVAMHGGDSAFLRALGMTLDTLIDVCRHYETQARAMADASADATDRQRLEAIAETLEANVDHAPHTLREAIQLSWLCLLLTCAKHPETWRPDVAFGDLYAQDIDEGRLTEEDALELILGLWRQVRTYGDSAVSRTLIGGHGRRNEVNADRFALAAIEATRRHRDVIPQLTLRFHSGQNPALLAKAFDVLGEGCIFPMLYNDDAILPGVVRALNVSADEAQKYHPLGCGEYMLAGCSPSLLNCGMSVPKSLEAAMRNGLDSKGEPLGPATGDALAFTRYDELWQAFQTQVAFDLDMTARVHEINNRTLPQECAFLFASLLTDDCIERGRSLLDGGARYRGACVMAHGFTNAADGLMALKRAVYDRSDASLGDVLSSLDADFAGHEALRKQLLAAPKFGNDNDEVDAILVDTWRRLGAESARAGTEVGMDFFTVSSVNPGGYQMGHVCGATPDGRKSGMPFAIGHAPMAGRDKRGISAFLNSVAKADPANGGVATNVKLSREYFTRTRPKLDALFDAFFAQGGQQVSVSVVNQQDLEAAMHEPEGFPHLLVRVGGWTARFIDLERDVQEDILLRTAY